MRADDLLDIMTARLVRTYGGSRFVWRRRVGSVRIYGTDTHPHCNWTLTPTGTSAQVEVIETLLDELRLQHPMLTRD
jgi:hypothetical protein